MEDFEVEDRTAHLLKLASKATARALQDKLAEHDVSYGHWTFLRILWQRDGLSVTQLSEMAGVAKPATVTAIRSMEQSGYVERRQKAGNLKAVYIHLTDAGRALESRLVPLALDVNDQAMRGISQRQQEALRSALARIIRNLGARTE